MFCNKKSTTISRCVLNHYLFILSKMEKDIRYESVKVMIETGRIREFQQIFSYLPKSILAHDLGTNNNRMTRLINHVEQFSLEELFRISHLLDVSYKTILTLVHNQYFGEQKINKQTGKGGL